MSHDAPFPPESEVPMAGARAVLLALAAVAAAVSVAAPAPLAGQFSVRPVLIDFPTGSATTRVATVKNEGDRPRDFRVYVSDYDRARDGDHEFLEAGEHERSCRDRISVFPDRLTVEPGGAVEARITVEPGARTCWSLVFFETTRGDTTGVRIGQRIGVKVFGVGREVRTRASVDGVVASPGEGGARVSFDVVNSGGTVVRPTGDVEIRTLEGEVVSTREIRGFNVLPGHTRRVEVRVPGELRAGGYLAVPLLDVGAEYLIGGQARLRVPPARSAGVAAGG